jgi:hypothetical protein
METTENLILKLNELLSGDKFYIRKFDYILKKFKELGNSKIILIDFEYYNPERLGLIKKKKMACINNQNYEEAAGNRILETECQNYITLREEYGITKSMFFFEKEYLFYFYFGSAKIDKKVRRYLKL